MSACQNKITYFVYKLITDSETLTVTSEATDFPLTNLQAPNSQYYWQSTSDAVQTISGTISPQYVNFLILYDTNFSDTAIITLNLKYNSVLVKSIEFESIEPTIGYGEGGYGEYGYGGYVEDIEGEKMDLSRYLGEDVMCDEFELIIDDTDNPDNFIRVARFALADALIPFGGISNGVKFDVEMNDATFRTQNLGTVSFEGHTAKKLSFNCQWPVDDLPEIKYMKVILRNSKNIYISVYPTVGGNLTKVYSGLYLIQEFSGIEMQDDGKLAFSLTLIEDV